MCERAVDQPVQPAAQPGEDLISRILQIQVDGRPISHQEALSECALVLFGGEGASSMIDIARRLSESGLNLQLIMMYGRNEKLGERLRALRLKIPVHLQGFTADVPRFMQMADFMLGKPGPGSITEALAMRLPVIVDCNAWTMPQERYNAEWLTENQLGMVVKNWRGVVDAVRRILAPGTLDAYRARAAKVENHAVFEIADWLETVIERGP